MNVVMLMAEMLITNPETHPNRDTAGSPTHSTTVCAWLNAEPVPDAAAEVLQALADLVVELDGVHLDDAAAFTREEQWTRYILGHRNALMMSLDVEVMLNAGSLPVERESCLG